MLSLISYHMIGVVIQFYSSWDYGGTGQDHFRTGQSQFVNSFQLQTFAPTVEIFVPKVKILK